MFDKHLEKIQFWKDIEYNMDVKDRKIYSVQKINQIREREQFLYLEKNFAEFGQDFNTSSE